jgi:hypothetical protein
MKNTLKPILILGSMAALVACSTLTPAIPSLVSTGVTLADIAAKNNTTVNQLVTDGQLFCAEGATIVAVLTAGSQPTSVKGIASNVVAQGCPIVNSIQSVPVSPPANPAATPVATNQLASALVKS